MAMSPAQERVPPPPGAPSTPPPGPPQIITTGPNGTTIIEVPQRPLTARDLQALRERGWELSGQLTSVNNRRDRLAGQLEDAEGSNKAGIEQRIAQLDQRIIGIEGDIAQNGPLLGSAPASALLSTAAETRPPNPLGLNPGQITGIAIVGTIFVGFPLAVAMARNIWRRGLRHAPPPASAESNQRMERLEQAVDAIAIEIERVSEGQRFVTRLLTEGSAPALSVGQKPAEPVRFPEREALRAPREPA